MKRMTLIALTVLTLSGCDFPIASRCEDTIRAEVRSPGGKHIATLFERNCGATAALVTYVNLRESSTEFDVEEGNIFLVEEEPQQVNIVWNNAEDLHMECLECGSEDVFKQEKSWKDLTITY